MKSYFYWMLIVVLFVQCKKETTIADKDIIVIDTVPKVKKDTLKQDTLTLVEKDTLVEQKVESKPEIIPEKKKKVGFEITQGEKYSIWPHSINDSLRKKFNEEFSAEQKYIIAALNRIDTDHIARRDSLIVPNEFYDDFLQYSPFPHKVNVLNDVDKFLIFSYPVQAFAVYEKGVLMKWGPSNMGKKATQTPRGLFFTNWKGRRVRSTVDEEWILNWNFNIHNTGGIGFHQYALPG